MVPLAWTGLASLAGAGRGLNEGLGLTGGDARLCGHFLLAKTAVRGAARSLRLVEHFPLFSVCLEDALSFQAVEANEYVDHSAVPQGHFISKRIELRIEGHLLSALALRRLILLDPVRFAAYSMALADWISGPLKAD